MYNGYIHINENGIKIPAEGIRVSDGCNVTITDDNGYFSLDGYEKTRFIFVTTPSGYRSKNWYLPISKNEKSYDFLLEPYEPFSGSAHSFLQITDTEVNKDGATEWADYLKTYISSEKPAFVVQTGDICYEAGLRTHIRDINENTMGCPVYYCIGNHDYIKNDELGGEALYESLYGPVWYSFDCGNIHYVALTTDCYLDNPSAYNLQDTQRWLANDLKNKNPDMGLIIFSHGIPSTERETIADVPDLPIINLCEYGLLARVYGHYHFRCVRKKENGVISISTAPPDKGGTDHSLMAFSRVDISSEQEIKVRSRHFYIPRMTELIFPPSGVDGTVISDNIPIEASCYYHGADTVRAEIKLSTAEVQEVVSLKPSGEWHWQGTIPKNIARAGTVKAELTAYFNDGSSVKNISQFELVNSCDSKKGIWHMDWVRHLKAHGLFCAPIWTEKLIIAATCDDDGGQNAVWAFDPQNGDVVWKYPIRNSVKNVLGYENGTVVAQDAIGWVYAIDVEDGSLIWEYELPFDKTYFIYTSEGILVDNGVVYAGSGEALSALRLTDGKLIWQSKNWYRRTSSCQHWTRHGNILISGIQWGLLFGCDINTGEILWENSGNKIRFRSSSPVEDPYESIGTSFYLQSCDTLYKIDYTTGNILGSWQYEGYNFEVAATPLITEDLILLASANMGILAVDRITKEEKWSFTPGITMVGSSPYTRQPDSTVESSVIRHGDLATFGASDGYLYTINLCDGTLAECHKLGAPILATPSIDDRGITVMDIAGGIYKFS